MIKSESIAKLADALSKAQGPEDESEALHVFFADRRPTQNFKHRSITEAFFARIAFTSSDCWYWVGPRSDIGYGMFAAARNSYDFNEIVAHRISWTLLRGPIPGGLKVLHRCDVRACVNPDHLFLGTQLDNMRDCAAKGRYVLPTPMYGEGNPRHRLTAAQVAEIRDRYKNGNIQQKALAMEYGVSPMTINRVVHGKLWRDV